jgi:hypothetical protein
MVPVIAVITMVVFIFVVGAQLRSTCDRLLPGRRQLGRRRRVNGRKDFVL